MTTSPVHSCPVRRKHRATVAAIRALACLAGPGGKLPTVRELSARLAVAKATVDDALDTLAAHGLVRRKHGSGIYVLPAIRQKTVGIVFGGDIFSPGFSPFWSLLLQAIQAQTAGCDLQPRAYLDIAGGRQGLGDHHQLMEDLHAERLHALLLIAPQSGWDECDFVRSLTIPLVTLDARDMGWVAGFDERALLRLAAHAVVDGGPARRIALLGFEPNRELLEDELRGAGYAGEPVLDWSHLHWASRFSAGDTQEHCARRLVAQLLSSAGREAVPDVIVSTEDTMTRGAVTALQGAGLQVGRDVRIVTSENRGSPVLEPYADCLTRIVFDPAECIRAALGMLEVLMDGGTPPERMVLIAPHLAGTPDAASIVPVRPRGEMDT
jgi:DNA-binding LacI/PurR family transcriptional regulator